MGQNISGEVKFYINGRCFFYSSDKGLPNSLQILQEMGQGNSEKRYFVSISGHELSQVYDRSNLLD